MKYEVVIGLEVHAQLKTKTKVFCGCSTQFGSSPNSQTCPVCLGMPGVLPVPNKEAVAMGIKTALALGCKIRNRSVFARKNYFYPDLPKGYQISQFELPFSEHGCIEIETESGSKKIGITRIHMEEDAGKNIHEESGSRSKVDLNRAGVPLIEIVSEPDLRSAEDAAAYLKKLRNILVCLDVCDGNMEEGSFRCDANVSIRPVGEKKLGVRAEIKNVNSFRYIQKAIEFEIHRQEKLLEKGERVIQETRLWDSSKSVTYSMRSKEDSNDYRYFPDPDLPWLYISNEWIEEIKERLPELPEAKELKFQTLYGLPADDAKILAQDSGLSKYYEEAVSYYNQPKKIANWILSELLRELNKDEREIYTCPVTPKMISDLVKMIDDNIINGKIAKTVLEDAYQSGKSPEVIVKEKGLLQVTDDEEIKKVIMEVISENPNEKEAYKAGKTKLMGFFVGEVMKKTKGKANPGMVNNLIRQALD